MTKLIIANFNKYSKVDISEDLPEEEIKAQDNTKDFQIYRDLQDKNGKSGREIFYEFLVKIFDQRQDVLNKFYIQYVVDLCKAQVLDEKSIAQALS